MAIAVFVYGSLKQGFGNHRQMAGATFSGEARVSSYALCAVQGANFPAVVEAEPEYGVHGEVYTLADGEEGKAHLRRLDRFEGCPRMYRRVAVRTDAGSVAWMYVWAGKQQALQPLETETWEGAE